MKNFLKFTACALLLGQLAYADFTQNQKVRTSLDILNDLSLCRNLNQWLVISIRYVNNVTLVLAILTGRSRKV